MYSLFNPKYDDNSLKTNLQRDGFSPIQPLVSHQWIMNRKITLPLFTSTTEFEQVITRAQKNTAYRTLQMEGNNGTAFKRNYVKANDSSNTGMAEICDCVDDNYNSQVDTAQDLPEWMDTIDQRITDAFRDITDDEINSYLAPFDEDHLAGTAIKKVPVLYQAVFHITTSNGACYDDTKKNFETLLSQYFGMIKLV